MIDEENCHVIRFLYRYIIMYSKNLKYQMTDFNVVTNLIRPLLKKIYIKYFQSNMQITKGSYNLFLNNEILINSPFNKAKKVELSRQCCFVA